MRSFYALHGRKRTNAIYHTDNTVKTKIGLGPYATVQTTKVQKGGGKVGKRKKIPESVKELLMARWQQVLGDTFVSYDDMRTGLSSMRVCVHYEYIL